MKKIFGLIIAGFGSIISVHAQVQLVASNLGNDFSVTYPANLGSPVTVPSGLMITFKALASISGTATLNVNGSGAKTIKKQVSLNLQAGEILNGQFVTVIYDGTFFQMLSIGSQGNGNSWLIGGNSVSSSNTIGTLNASDLSIISNNIESIRISSATGYVGIGTSSPTMPFHVRNNIAWTNTVVGFNGSGFFENTLLSTQTSIGIALYVKSTASSYGVASVFEGGQLGVYATANITGTGTRTGVRGIAQAGDNARGLEGTGEGILKGTGVRAYGNSNTGSAYGADLDGYSTDGDAYGAYANAYSSNGSTAGISLYSRSDNGASACGVRSENYLYNTGGIGYGVYSFSQAYGTGYAVYAQNTGAGGGVSYGIYADATNGTSNYAGYFDNGDVLVRNRATIGIGTPYSSTPILHIYNANATGMAEVIRLSGGDCNSTSGPMLSFQNKCDGFTPGSYPDWITAGIGSPYSGSYSGDLAFYTNDGSVTSGSIQSLERMRITRLGRVGINTSTPNAQLEVNGFTKLGNNAPAIKNLYLTGITPNAQGGSITVAHGLNDANILAVNVIVEYATGFFVPNSYTRNPGYQFDFYFGGGVVYIYNSAASSGSILSKPCKIFITYQ